MPFSTLITKIYWNMKMQDQESEGYFIEYKDITDHWKPRVEKIIKEINEKGYTTGTFLVGSKPYKVYIHEVQKVVGTLIPNKYAGALKGHICYAIKCELMDK